jgi:hypothetical protein
MMNAKVFQEGKGVWHENASPTMRSLGGISCNRVGCSELSLTRDRA